MHTIIPTQPSPADMRLGDAAELNARIVAAAAVLADYEAEEAAATRPPGREWAARLAAHLELVLDALNDREEGQDEGDLDGLEPYCTECGAWTGMFYGMEGWHHFRGDPSPGGQRQLYDAGHDTVVAWCQPPGRGISPAGAATIREALIDAEMARRERAAAWCVHCEQHPAGACDRHVDDLDQADAYAGLARQLAQEDGQ